MSLCTNPAAYAGRRMQVRGARLIGDLVDANIALGNLIGVVRHEERHYLAAQRRG